MPERRVAQGVLGSPQARMVPERLYIMSPLNHTSSKSQLFTKKSIGSRSTFQRGPSYSLLGRAGTWRPLEGPNQGIPCFGMTVPSFRAFLETSSCLKRGHDVTTAQYRFFLTWDTWKGLEFRGGMEKSEDKISSSIYLGY